jgi:hypothetical protein
LQAGFTLLEIGGARIVNPKTTLIKVCWFILIFNRW